MTDLVQYFCGRKQMPLQSFLLPEDHSIIVKYYQSLMVKDLLRSGDSLAAAGYDYHDRNRSRVSLLKKPAKKDKHDQAFQEMGYKKKDVWHHSDMDFEMWPGPRAI